MAKFKPGDKVIHTRMTKKLKIYIVVRLDDVEGVMWVKGIPDNTDQYWTLMKNYRLAEPEELI